MLINSTRVADPLVRRQALTALSGTLILAGLAVEHLIGRPAVASALMVAAALLAGSDIALRAWHALHRRHIGIELLVTIATAGALALGEVWEAAAVTFLFMLGAYLEARTLSRTRRALQDLLDLAPIQSFIERFARWYTPAIIGLSALALLITHNVALALTLLVIGCPGALVIATPVAVVAGIGHAARRGILIKGGTYLERAGGISAVALDKTGTVTQGRPWLTDVIALRPALAPAYNLEEIADGAAAVAVAPAPARWTAAEQELLRWAAIAEAGSEHPLARPIMAEAAALGEIPHAAQFNLYPGRGVRAVYQGHGVAVGTRELMSDLQIDVGAEAAARLARLKSEGKTAMLVALDGIVLGILAVADVLRAGASEMIAQLRKRGVERIVMLTGDDRRTAEAIAATAGISEVAAELLPDDKLAAIRQLQGEGHVVAMVGDGINDAPALAAADIGIAMGAAGTDVAIETADIALMADDLGRIPEAIGLSKATLHIIRQNVGIALLVVGGLLLGVLLGVMHMAGGMFIHELSVLLVIGNGMRLLRSGRP